MKSGKSIFKLSRSQWISVAVLASSLGIAAAVTVPNTFTAGTAVSSSQVNANFTALGNAVTNLESLGGPLPTGKTLRGMYIINYQAAGASSVGSAFISFPIPLASAPTVNFIAAGGAATVPCAGSATNPTATAGNLCVYETRAANYTPGAFSPCFSDSAFIACGLADKRGFNLEIFSIAAGMTYTSAVWAVTAP